MCVYFSIKIFNYGTDQQLIFFLNVYNYAIALPDESKLKLSSPELLSIPQNHKKTSEDSLTEQEKHQIEQFIIRELNINTQTNCSKISTDTITSLSEQIVNAFTDDNFLVSRANPSGIFVKLIILDVFTFTTTISMLAELLSPNTCTLNDSRKNLFRENIYRSNFKKNKDNSLLSQMCIINSTLMLYYESLKCSGNRSFIFIFLIS
ncbi:hypothetical protein HZS_1435 [Henneguya salminicola]|nr:hypothetical protein HZS_1435 [Henneguya salminicola]